MAIKIAKKLSTKAIIGGKPKIPEAGQVNWLYKVVGIASTIKTGVSNFGEWTALMGQFIVEVERQKADPKTGELLTEARIDEKTKKPVVIDGKEVTIPVMETVQMRTGQLFLPDVALNLVGPALEAAGKGASVQFAFKVGVERDDTAATGYTYTAESLIAPEENDPLEMLMAKALPAPAAPATA